MEVEQAKPPIYTPTRWWQWFLIYPSLLVASLGALPTLLQAIKAYQLDTPFTKVQIIEQQHGLWERNVECLSKHLIYSVNGPNDLVVGVTLCATGDALLRYSYPGEEIIYRWVAAPTTKERQKSWPFR